VAAGECAGAEVLLVTAQLLLARCCMLIVFLPAGSLVPLSQHMQLQPAGSCTGQSNTWVCMVSAATLLLACRCCAGGVCG
jgi:hypothetical protein